MRLLDRYIARQVFVSAMFAVAVIIIILVLGNVFKEILRELAKRPDLSLVFVIKFILLIIPISLSLAVPFSFLTAILLVFGRLSADSEFVSMRMAGLSMVRICLPVALLALFFTGVCAWVNLSVTPWAKMQMEGMKASMINLIQLDPMLLFPDREVMTRLDDHLIYANKDGDRLNSFQMVKMEGNLPEALVIARTAEVSVDLEGDNPELVLELAHVNLLLRGEGEDFLSASQPVFMDEASTGVSVAVFKERGELAAEKPDNLGLFRLLEKIGDDEVSVEERTSYRTELSMRMAFSIACITFGLIGVPLGITAQRRESTAGFILSMIIAVTYYVMLTTARMMREDERLYPHLLVWVPNVLFLTLGAWLFWRVSRR